MKKTKNIYKVTMENSVTLVTTIPMIKEYPFSKIKELLKCDRIDYGFFKDAALFVDEQAQVEGMDVNPIASAIAGYAIAGDAVVATTFDLIEMKKELLKNGHYILLTGVTVPPFKFSVI